MGEDRSKRFEVLRYLARRIARGEGSPGVREVGEAVGLKSSQTAYQHLRKLEEAGYIALQYDCSKKPPAQKPGASI